MSLILFGHSFYLPPDLNESFFMCKGHDGSACLARLTSAVHESDFLSDRLKVFDVLALVSAVQHGSH